MLLPSPSPTETSVEVKKPGGGVCLDRSKPPTSLPFLHPRPTQTFPTVAPEAAKLRTQHTGFVSSPKAHMAEARLSQQGLPDNYGYLHAAPAQTQTPTHPNRTFEWTKEEVGGENFVLVCIMHTFSYTWKHYLLRCYNSVIRPFTSWKLGDGPSDRDTLTMAVGTHNILLLHYPSEKYIVENAPQLVMQSQNQGSHQAIGERRKQQPTALSLVSLCQSSYLRGPKNN
ncbi:hypothetical protein BJ508DRAFT_377655 [Ascobolus immersus RN42]|uniref:Uncharacterized protein n=1 Tax=Ascobolus immersus RN42 TaxID=1160509 RepID=A0A3N4I437_ASCIM|nr:hypothetical protein BJ508DRAFT_377655 [Ascobolus immersus RN42]